MKKLSICILLSNTFDPDFPTRPEISEIYGTYLPLFGHNITWIMPTFKKEEDYTKKHFKKINIYNLYHNADNDIGSLFRIYNYFLFYFKKYMFLKKLIKEKKFDIIQARNNIFDSFLLLILKIRYKFVFVFQYSFPKGKYEFKHLRDMDSFFKKFEELSINYVLKNADLVLPISEWMKDDLIKNGVPENKMLTLPMGINSKNFSTENKKNLRQKYHLQGKKIILYVGVLGNNRNLETIIKSISKLKRYDENICLMIVGSGASETKLKKLTVDLELSKYILFIGQVPYNEVPNYIFTSDICLSPIPPLPIFTISSPTKLFEYMALEKPVIANKGIFEHEQVLNQSGGGILVNFNSDSFAEGIIELLNNPEKSKKMGKKGRKWVLNNREYKKMAMDIQNLFLELYQRI
jgi:glycosyltransferase involved in cell wall biosynthesis